MVFKELICLNGGTPVVSFRRRKAHSRRKAPKKHGPFYARRLVTWCKNIIFSGFKKVLGFLWASYRCFKLILDLLRASVFVSDQFRQIWPENWAYKAS